MSTQSGVRIHRDVSGRRRSGERRARVSRAGSVHGLEIELRRGGADAIAVERLEEIHAARGEWTEVARLCRERADLAGDTAEHVAALRRAAEVHRQRLSDHDGALRLLRRAFIAQPGDPAVADDLDQLARAGRVAPVRGGKRRSSAAAEVRALYTGAAAEHEVGAPDLAAELWLRAAALDVEVRRNPADALVVLKRIIPDAIPPHAAPLLDRIERDADQDLLDTLAEQARQNGDRRRRLRALLRSLDFVVDLGDRARRHRAISTLVFETGDDEGGEWHLREAQRLDPSGAPCGIAGDGEHDFAAAILADRYLRERRWHEAEPLLARLLRPGGAQAGGRAQISRADLHYRAGHVALELGKVDKACRLFSDALEYDPVHLPSLCEGARAAALVGRWNDVLDLGAQALSVQKSLGRPPTEQAESVVHMAEARAAGGDAVGARGLYDDALDLDPTNAAALDAVGKLLRARGDLPGLERMLRRALLRSDRAQRGERLLELASLAARGGDDAQAALLCREALAIAPGDRRALLPMADYYRAAGMWREAVDAVVQLAEQEAAVLRRGRYYELAAGLAENLAGDRAAALYERALDCFFAPGGDPPPAMRRGFVRVFEDLRALLWRRAEWKELERALRAMIKRLPAGAPELADLWAELGRVCRDHLGHRASAIQSFEVASSLDEDRLTHHRILIDLYQGVATDELDKLIARRRRLLAAEPFNPDHYSALRSLWVKTKQRDRVFCACRALVFLGAADRQESDFHRRNRPDSVVWPCRALGEAEWLLLRHPEEDAEVGQVMALIGEPIALARATSSRRLRLRDDESSSFDHVRHVYRNVCVALGARSVALYVAPWLEVDIVLANLAERGALTPAFAVGCHMYQGRSAPQMVHAMTRAVSYTRSGAYLRLLLGSSDLERVALSAAEQLVWRADARPRSGGAAGEALGSTLERAAADRVWLAELRGAMQRLRARDRNVDVERAGLALDKTARRAALLLSGSLSVAKGDLAREPLFAREVSREKRMADLLLHSISDEHFELRDSLRLAVDD